MTGHQILWLTYCVVVFVVLIIGVIGWIRIGR